MFIILSRGRNCKKYLKQYFHGLLNQTYKNWRAIIILDAPSDSSEQIVKKYADERFTVIVNKKRQGLCCNMWRGLQEAKKTKGIVAIVDLDDFLPKNALQIIHKKYKKSCLVTYGSYIKMSKRRKTRTSRPYKIGENIRKSKWRASHLKTFKTELINSLSEDMFKDKGTWLEAASDVALMFPIMELAGLSKCCHIKEITYYWRDKTKYKTNSGKQKKCLETIRKKPSL